MQHQLSVRLSVQGEEAGKNCPFTTFTHMQPAVTSWQMPGRNTKIGGKTERPNTDFVQAGRAVNPATSAQKTQRNQPKHI